MTKNQLNVHQYVFEQKPANNQYRILTIHAPAIIDEHPRVLNKKFINLIYEVSTFIRS